MNVFLLFADHEKTDTADNDAGNLFCSKNFLIEKKTDKQQDTADDGIADEGGCADRPACTIDHDITEFQKNDGCGEGIGCPICLCYFLQDVFLFRSKEKHDEGNSPCNGIGQNKARKGIKAFGGGFCADVIDGVCSNDNKYRP